MLGAIAVAALVNVIFLNMTGSIAPDTAIYIPWLNNLFAPNDSILLTSLPTVGYAVVLGVLTAIYRPIARKLNDAENYKTQLEYESRLTIKYVIFDAISIYISLVYVAFVQGSISALRSQLAVLFLSDQFRRLATYVVLPFVLLVWSPLPSFMYV
jgi:heme/copper-type cytochrome/quinol oxidase subunit 2